MLIACRPSDQRTGPVSNSGGQPIAVGPPTFENEGFAFEMFPSLVKNEGFKLAWKRLIGCGRLVDCRAKCSFVDVSLFAFMGSFLLLLSRH